VVKNIAFIATQVFPLISRFSLRSLRPYLPALSLWFGRLTILSLVEGSKGERQHFFALIETAP
jgi:hypothetical protein